MGIFSVFIKTVLPIFVIVGVAFLFNRFKEIELKPITDITLIVFAPLFVFHSLLSQKVSVGILFRPFLFMILLITALAFISLFVFKITGIDEKYKIPFLLAVTMINVGNFGLPLIDFAFGEKGIYWSIIYFIAFNVPLSTFAIVLSSNESNILRSLKDVAKIPLFHAFIIAMIFSGFNIELPDFLNKAFSLMSSAAIPMLIFILGLQLSKIRFSRKLVRPALIASFLRLVVSPLIALLLVSLLGIKSIEGKVAVVQTSAPSALLPLMYAIRFDRSPEFLSTVILMTTVLSGITLSVLITILN